MPTVRLDLAYHGGAFAGWAAQPGLRTVQGELTDALRTVLREPVTLSVAGRTDAGVHALHQVASFTCAGQPDMGTLRHSLNGITAEDVVLLAAGPTEDGFDARRDARSRTYLYRVLTSEAPSPFERGLSLWWPHPIDSQLLARCAEMLPGTHDFTAFTPTQTEHVHFRRSVLRAEWSPDPPLLDFWIEADAFMRNMVRVLVGTMLEVAAGRRGADDFAALLEGAPRERAGETAAAHGLYLADVAY